MLRAGWFPRRVLLVLVTVVGCADADAPRSLRTFEVKGKVELADGKPLAGGKVRFISAKHIENVAVGVIQSDGSFELETAGSGKGAPADDYRVCIDPPELNVEEAKSKMKTRGRAKGKPPFLDKYTDEDTSGLTATVKPEANQLEPFRLK